MAADDLWRGLTYAEVSLTGCLLIANNSSAFLPSQWGGRPILRRHDPISKASCKHGSSRRSPPLIPHKGLPRRRVPLNKDYDQKHRNS